MEEWRAISKGQGIISEVDVYFLSNKSNFYFWALFSEFASFMCPTFSVKVEFLVLFLKTKKIEIEVFILRKNALWLSVWM